MQIQTGEELHGGSWPHIFIIFEPLLNLETYFARSPCLWREEV